MGQLSAYSSPYNVFQQPRGGYQQPFQEQPQVLQVQPVQPSGTADQTLSLEAMISLLQKLPALTTNTAAYKAFIADLTANGNGALTAAKLLPVLQAQDGVTSAERTQMVLSLLPLFGGMGGGAGGGGFLQIILLMKILNPDSTGLF